MELVIRKSIDCAHYIPDSKDLLTKKCANLHGHTYNIEIAISLEVLQTYYKRKFVDFALVGGAISTITNNLDHKDISKEFGLYTVEDVAKKIKDTLVALYNCRYQQVKVEIFETAKYGIRC